MMRPIEGCGFDEKKCCMQQKRCITSMSQATSPCQELALVSLYSNIGSRVFQQHSKSLLPEGVLYFESGPFGLESWIGC